MKDEHSKLKEEKRELVSKLNKLKKQLYKLTRYDALTKLPNRKKLVENFKASMKKGKPSGKAIFLLDIDRFHSINELYGRKVGDELLVQLSKRLRSLLGKEDSVYYQGEDEFYLLLDAVSYFELRQLGGEIHKAVAKPFKIEGRMIYITASIGMSHYPMTGEDIELLLLQAEIAMYKVKQNGKDDYQVFLLEDTEIVERQRSLEFGLNEALQNKELFLVYQPKVTLNTGKVHAVEALLRWEHPQLGLISPGEFIPIAEESGMIIDIGYWVIDEVIRQTKDWHDQGLKMSTSVNVSPLQFGDKHLVERIIDRLNAHQLPSQYLIVEITESVMLDYTHAKQVINELHQNNIQVAIDDFGTGYSSLSVLNNLYIDMVKIDRSFIQNIPSHSKSVTLVKTMIQMGENLGFDIIAEGIESADQSDFLIENDCGFGQGYYFSKPITSLELEDYLKKEKEA